MELVSVLIPCRNAAPWLEEALRSVLSQTWKRVEAVVIDDGSWDGSYELAQRFASPRCKVVRQDHAGASAARNHALRLAQGTVIQYLDADDFLAHDKIELQMAQSSRRGSGCLSWSSVRYLLQGIQDGAVRLEPARAASLDGAGFLARLWGGEGQPGMVLVHQWLTPRALIERAGLWDERLSVDDDGEFFARVVLASSAGIAVPEALCFYRKFHNPGHLAGAAAHDSRHERGAITAACLKAAHLLARAPGDPRAGRAVSRLLTQQIIDAYPQECHRNGLDFLAAHALPISADFEAPPWFQRLRPFIGWRAARRLQRWAREWRARVKRRKPSWPCAWPAR